MTCYHFHIRDGMGYIEDEEGRELPGLDVARSEALKGARSLLAEEVLQGQLDLSGSIEVTDKSGALLLVVTFAEAVIQSP